MFNKKPALGRWSDLQQHVLHIDQMIVENGFRYIEKLENGLIRNGVIHITARFPADDNIANLEDRELLGNVRWFNLQSFAELIHTFLAVAKAVEDPNSDRVREGPEKLRFEVGELLRHAEPSLFA